MRLQREDQERRQRSSDPFDACVSTSCAFLKGLQCQNWQDDRPTNAGTCVSRFRLLLFVWVIVSGDITVKGHDIETIGVLKRRYDKRGIGYQPAGDTRQSRIPESNEDTLLTLSCFGPM